MTLINHIDRHRAKGFTLGKKVLLTIGGVLYLVSPIDLLPEFVPLLGVVDDLGMFVLLAKVWLSPTLRPRRATTEPAAAAVNDAAIAST